MEIDAELLELADEAWELAKAEAERDGSVEPQVIFVREKEPLIADLTEFLINNIALFDVVSDMAKDCQATCVIVITHSEAKTYSAQEFEQKSASEREDDLDNAQLGVLQILSFAWGNSFYRFAPKKEVGGIVTYKGHPNENFMRSKFTMVRPW